MPVNLDGIPYCLGGIMRHDKVSDSYSVYIGPCIIRQDPGASGKPSGSKGMPFESHGKGLCRIYRLTQPLAERAEMPHMVKMVMSNDYGTE